jgi:hypothetical protein
MAFEIGEKCAWIKIHILINSITSKHPTTQNCWMLQHNCKSPSRMVHRIPHLQTKRRKKLQSSVKNMHYSINPEDIEIEKLGYTVKIIWNIKQHRTKLPLSMFFVDLKPAPNNKDIFNVEHIQQCKIKFELPKHKRDIAKCANCQRYGHTINYCHLKPRSVKCAGDHLTNQC